MKRMIAIVLVILTMTATLAGCRSTNTGTGMTNGTTTTDKPETNNNSTSGSMTEVPSYDAGSGTPSSSEDGIIEDTRPDAQNDNVIKDFSDDMQDMVDDAGNAVEDVIDGRASRSNRTGTGMSGGR